MTTTASVTQDLVIKTIQGLQKAVETGWDFAREQLPDMAMQFVAFGRAYDSFMILFSIALFVGVVVCIVKAIKSSDESVVAASLIVGTIGFTMGSIIFFSNIKSFMMVWFAPKIWLMVELAKFLK